MAKPAPWHAEAENQAIFLVPKKPLRYLGSKATVPTFMCDTKPPTPCIYIADISSRCNAACLSLYAATPIRHPQRQPRRPPVAQVPVGRQSSSASHGLTGADHPGHAEGCTPYCRCYTKKGRRSEGASPSCMWDGGQVAGLWRKYSLIHNLHIQGICCLVALLFGKRFS